MDGSHNNGNTHLRHNNALRKQTPIDRPETKQSRFMSIKTTSPGCCQEHWQQGQPLVLM